MRRRGVASALVRAALDLAPAADANLECRASNAAALRLYEKLGFETVGARAKYYADGEDCVLMTRVAPAVSARELTRLLAGLSPGRRARPYPEEKQRAESFLPGLPRAGGVCAQPRKKRDGNRKKKRRRRRRRGSHAEQDTQVMRAMCICAVPSNATSRTFSVYLRCICGYAVYPRADARVRGVSRYESASRRDCLSA